MRLPPFVRSAVLLVAVAFSANSGRALTIDETRLTAYGTFEEKSADNVRSPLTAAGYTIRNSDEKLLKTTAVIEAKVGTSFGIDYILYGRPVGRQLNLFIRLRRPAITNPATGETTTVDENVTPAWISLQKHDGFRFEYPWELVPGKWTFQVFHDSKLLLEKEFEVRLAAK
ncbi:MAG: DUF3859 domain-containing protein [Chthoniobacterales bacterium]